MRENDRRLDHVTILMEIIGEWGLIVIIMFSFQRLLLLFWGLIFVSFSIEYRLFTLKYKENA